MRIIFNNNRSKTGCQAPAAYLRARTATLFFGYDQHLEVVGRQLVGATECALPGAEDADGPEIQRLQQPGDFAGNIVALVAGQFLFVAPVVDKELITLTHREAIAVMIMDNHAADPARLITLEQQPAAGIAVPLVADHLEIVGRDRDEPP